MPPLPKSRTICDFNKDLRPISLASTLSKVAESFIIEQELKPVILSFIDPAQYGFILRLFLHSCPDFHVSQVARRHRCNWQDYKNCWIFVNCLI